ncbi:hypothetical protein ACFFQF_22140 [Haladaptatus pallidirubidus]|nr:hypothetical protein [Haladaptatus pallidirubidus]
MSELSEVLTAVGGHHIITFGHPDLAGWKCAYEANAERNGGR